MTRFKKWLPIISLIVAIATYSLILPLYFAIGLTLMILVHELGHVLAAKQRGIPVSAPLFIPFLGAFIAMRKNPRDVLTEAYIALGGPVIGTLGALLTLSLGIMLQQPKFIITANIGFYLNLVNLLPLHPLDGGRIANAVSRWLWLVGLSLGLIAVIAFKSLIFFVMWLIFAWQAVNKVIRRRNETAYYTITPMQRLRYGIAYVGIIIVLIYLINIIPMISYHIMR